MTKRPYVDLAEIFSRPLGTPAQVRTHNNVTDQVLEESYGEMLKARDERVRRAAIKEYKDKRDVIT